MIRIAAAALAELRAHCARARPEEACGLLVGAGDEVMRAEPAENVAEDRLRRFEIDPRLLLRLHRELRDGPLAVLGVYHSHPCGRPEPSAVDLAKALDPELAWLIVGADGAVRAWRIEDGQAREIAIEESA
jgi:proteasome lid subunit RPN8/RPN11